jgi:hypothetical protein
VEFVLSDAVRVLQRTPSTLRAALPDLPPAWLRGDEGPETWSPYDVVGHLVHGERADWIPRARMILEHGEGRAFEPFDRFAMFRESQGKTLGDLLREFETLRAASLETLVAWNLQPADLAQRGRHPDFGPVTLEQLLATWVVHDLGHVAQIHRVLARQYGAQVGPWKAYLPVLTR